MRCFVCGALQQSMILGSWKDGEGGLMQYSMSVLCTLVFWLLVSMLEERQQRIFGVMMIRFVNYTIFMKPDTGKKFWGPYSLLAPPTRGANTSLPSP